jgi:hypothetical protein
MYHVYANSMFSQLGFHLLPIGLALNLTSQLGCDCCRAAQQLVL